MSLIKYHGCGKCGLPHLGLSGSYCKPCHAEYMRSWRRNRPLAEGPHKRYRARQESKKHLRRGNLVPRPCEACGSPESQIHHQDHERPLEVNWLCRPCHLAWHNYWRAISRETFDRWLAAEIQRRCDASSTAGIEPGPREASHIPYHTTANASVKASTAKNANRMSASGV